MKTYPKIDIYFYGDYVCSTNQSKTCREALKSLIDRLETRSNYLGLVESRILKVVKSGKAKALKARFAEVK